MANIKGNGMGTLFYTSAFKKDDSLMFNLRIFGEVRKCCTYIGVCADKHKD